MMYFAKIEYNRTVSCRGLFHIAFPLIFNGSSVFMKYSICQTHPRKKKSYLTRNVSRVFLQTKLQNLLFDRRTCFQKYINMIPNACGQRTQQKTKSKWFSSVLHGDQKYFEKMYIFVIPDDAIQYVYKKIAFKFIMK